jgi:VWFA-related protein
MLRFSRKWWAITVGSFLAVILLTFGVLSLVINSSSSEQAASSTNKPASSTSPDSSSSGGSGSGGTSLSGNKLAVRGSVVSLRNLKGLLAQINQIDVCQAPDLTAYVTVTAEDASAISKLTKGDFTVTIDGKESKDFTLELVSKKDLPLQTTLVIDHSGSMKGDPMVKAKEAAIGYINRTRPQDKTSVIQFDTSIDTLLPMSSDRNAAINAINGIVPRGDTSLYDAVGAASDQSPACGRKATVLLSDGEDTASKAYNVDTAIAKANTVSTPVFVVGLKSPGFSPSILRSIAEKTGAQYFEAPTPADISGMYEKISSQLGNQYYVSFKLNVPKTGGEHRLKISSTVEGSPTTSERSFVY